MSCPTCDHTMQQISTGERHYWCPRCGTLREHGSHFDDDAVPKLVEGCREFLSAVHVHVTVGGMVRLDDDVDKLWRRLGIAESINRPEGRPK